MASSSTWLVSTSKWNLHPAWPTRFDGNRDPDDRETVARLVLHERDGATEVELTQGTFATEARRELHKAGWTDSLARLASHLASA